MAVEPRRGLHVDDRQPAVRLDVVRQPDSRPARMEFAGDSGGVHRLRVGRDVARPHRRVSRRPHWAALRRRRRRSSRRRVVGDQLRRQHTAAPLSRRCGWRHRCGRCVRCVRRQRAQVVSRSARTRRRNYGDGFWRGIRVDRVPDCEHDQVAGLRGDVPQVRPRAGRGRVSRQLVSSRARRGICRLTLDANSRIVCRAQSRLSADGNAAFARVLGDVRHVHSDRRRAD